MPVRLEPLDLAQLPSANGQNSQNVQNSQNGHLITAAGNPNKANLRNPNESVVVASNPLATLNNETFFSGNQIRFFDYNLYATKKTAVSVRKIIEVLNL